MVVEVIIRKDGIYLSLSRDRRKVEKLRDDEFLVERIGEYVQGLKKSSVTVVIFVSEELLFFKSFTLPLSTVNIKEAVQFQLEQLVPFEEGSYYYSYLSRRGNDSFHISLYALQHQLINSYMSQVADFGYTISGLYPEGQRYISKAIKKEKWALMTPGRYPKVLNFFGSRLEDRVMCYEEVEFSQLSDMLGTKKIYHRNRPIGSNFLAGDDLLEPKPMFKDFNMLPASYRRPDYYRKILFALIALNAAALLGLISLKEVRLLSFRNQVDSRIEELMPLVKEMKKLQQDEELYKSQVDSLTGLGKNPDLIKFFADLSSKLPTSSYLDQMRLDKKQNAIQIQGYTEDIGDLTEKLKGLGDAKLKSTSRRRDKTYFQLEVSLP